MGLRLKIRRFLVVSCWALLVNPQ